MFDFRLKVFHTVAKRLNFTKAAEELYITQPAVSKHIHEIERFYKTKLFERNGTRIKLTPAGKLLLRHAETLAGIHRSIESDLAAADRQTKGTIRLGASTTVAQYVLPKYLSAFMQKYTDVKVELISGNTEHIENLLAEGRADIGVVEGQSKRQHLKYTPFVKDELVLCTGSGNRLVKKPVITLRDLQQLPLIVRESGSGSLEVIAAALKKADIKLSQLKVEMALESTESIKTYLLHSGSFAFLSIHSIFRELKNKELKIIDVKDLEIRRYFYFITQQGDSHPLKDLLMRFLKKPVI